MLNELPKTFISYEKKNKRWFLIGRLYQLVAGVFFFILFWILAYFTNTPGLALRRYFAILGIKVAAKFNFRSAYKLIVMPMDSVRYFEFDFIWQQISNLKFSSYLDLSSPRLLPLFVLSKTSDLSADLINPDRRDLHETVLLAKSFGVSDRCHFYPELIDKVSLSQEGYDLITTVSVIEHIIDDAGAIKKLWSLLKPGGTLIITVPCAVKASEEYINQNDYGLLEANQNGFVFLQRYYDEELLIDRIFKTTGMPEVYRIYGEKVMGNYQKNVARKRTDPFYPLWREPYMVGREYVFVNKISDLQGIGVIAMKFVKNL